MLTLGVSSEPKLLVDRLDVDSGCMTGEDASLSSSPITQLTNTNDHDDMEIGLASRCEKDHGHPDAHSNSISEEDSRATTTASSCRLAGGPRRKSIPNKSASKDDFTPGIVFRIETNVHVLRKATTPSLLEAWIQKSSPSRVALVGIPKRSSNRPRAFSLETHQNISLSVSIDNESHSGGESEADLSLSPPKNPIAASMRRRASISITNGSSSGISVYSGSLAHLVPNVFLQSTSRRISTHGTAPGCACTSCGSTVTPYWRDGWAGDVMLCNACGLRFQKFARRCPSCRYIPRKEDSLGDKCVKCSTPWIVGPSL